MENIQSNNVRTLSVSGRTYHYYNLKNVAISGGYDLSKLPFTIKILLENLLRKEDGKTISKEDIGAVAAWQPQQSKQREIFSARRGF